MFSNSRKMHAGTTPLVPFHAARFRPAMPILQINTHHTNWFLFSNRFQFKFNWFLNSQIFSKRDSKSSPPFNSRKCVADVAILFYRHLCFSAGPHIRIYASLKWFWKYCISFEYFEYISIISWNSQFRKNALWNYTFGTLPWWQMSPDDAVFDNKYNDVQSIDLFLFDIYLI